MTQTGERGAATGAEVITEFLRHSPFVLHLGMRLESIDMSADTAQELRKFHGSRCLRRKSPAPFSSALSVEPGDITGFVME